MRTIRFVTGAALAAIAAGCAIRPGTEDSSLAPGTEWTATIVPTTTSAIRGTITFVRTDPPSQTRVIFALVDGTANAVRPWHVHFGVCGNDNVIVGKPAVYPPLVMSGSGSVNAVAQIPIELSPRTQYVVHVHESPTDMKTVISCAPLVRRTETTVATAR